jgi:hypothetical protein
VIGVLTSWTTISDFAIPGVACATITEIKKPLRPRCYISLPETLGLLALLSPCFRTVSLLHLLGILNAQEKKASDRDTNSCLRHVQADLEPTKFAIQMGITVFLVRE